MTANEMSVRANLLLVCAKFQLAFLVHGFGLKPPSLSTPSTIHSDLTPFHHSFAASAFLSCCLTLGTKIKVSFAQRIARLLDVGS